MKGRHTDIVCFGIKGKPPVGDMAAALEVFPKDSLPSGFVLVSGSLKLLDEKTNGELKKQLGEVLKAPKYNSRDWPIFR